MRYIVGKCVHVDAPIYHHLSCCIFVFPAVVMVAKKLACTEVKNYESGIEDVMTLEIGRLKKFKSFSWNIFSRNYPLYSIIPL